MAGSGPAAGPACSEPYSKQESFMLPPLFKLTNAVFRKLESFQGLRAGKWWPGGSVCTTAARCCPPQPATSSSGMSKKRITCGRLRVGNWLTLVMPDVDQFWLFKLGCDSGVCVAQGQALAPRPGLTQ